MRSQKIVDAEFEVVTPPRHEPPPPEKRSGFYFQPMVLGGKGWWWQAPLVLAIIFGVATLCDALGVG